MTKSSNERYHDYTGRTRTRAWLRSQGRPCWICGGQIDYAAPRTHPLAFEVDELVPVSRGGSATDRANVDAAHRICNQRRGNKPLSAMKKRQEGDVLAISPRPCDLPTEDASLF